MKTINHLLFVLALLCSWPFARMQAQQPQFSHQHGFYDQPFSLTIEAGEGLTVRYTTDGSEPTTASQLYTAPISIKGTTILRAVAFDSEQQPTAVTTATYLFVNDILKQSDAPAGYPSTWGKYTEINGTAPADYGMDPEMTNNQQLRPKIIAGLQSLPVLSIVTDRDNLFSHENDSVKGGIYIFTGPPVGDATGHGWTRPASIELFTAEANSIPDVPSPTRSLSHVAEANSIPDVPSPTRSLSHVAEANSIPDVPSPTRSLYHAAEANSIPDVPSPTRSLSHVAEANSSLFTLHSSLSSSLDLSTTCGLRLHGGHGRLAEKNPKHSFRLIFKEKYGPKSLKYPLFGPNGHQKFDQLVLRCHFGYSWQHWGENNRQRAQYTRDVWARRMQRRLGHTSVDALYVNVFINGMYWGMYNIAERVDDQFGKDCLGGAKADIDVIKIEESGGNHIEASEGTLDAWQQMTGLAARVGGSNNAVSGFPADISREEAYEALADSLLDIPAFIDYMLINQYGGNTDWDHHNWYALRRRGEGSQGFRFLCWDTELIHLEVNENVLGKNNGRQYPTGIFRNLLSNDDFARRYVRRAKELLSEDGGLGETASVELWDSLYNVVHQALYAEAARWGDYRRDVHPYSSRGELYTVDGQYAAERQRLLTQYFPYRSDIVLRQITDAVSIDDFEAPEGWEPLMAGMFHEWNGGGANAQPLDNGVTVDWNVGSNVGGGGAVAGFVNVEYNRFADLSAYEALVLRGSGTSLRILANRLVDHGEYKEITVNFNESDRYWNKDLGCIVVPLVDLCNARTSKGNVRNDAFFHLHTLKVGWGNNSVHLNSAWLIPAELPDALHTPLFANHGQHRIYDLQGRPVSVSSASSVNSVLPKGIYIIDGKKVVIR